MKKILMALAVCLSAQQLTAQSLAVNTDGSTANATALLDVKSTTKGILVPRMTKSEKASIASPATGLLIFQSGPDSVGFYFYNGTQWSLLNAAGADWSTTGNSGTSASANFIGNIDNVALSLRQNNAWLGRLNNSTQNYLIGDSAGVNLTGTGNIAIGRKALKNLTTPGGNIAIGDSSLASSTASFPNTAIGFNSGARMTSGGGNTAIGYTALAQDLSGSDNTMIGSEAGRITTSSQNTGLGAHALYSNTSGNQNTALGYQASYLNTTGVWNVVIGNNANFLNQSGSRNVAIGVGSMFFNTASSSTTVGAEAGAHNIQPNLVAIGDGAAFWNSDGSTTQGLENTAVGFRALLGNTIGNKNTAIGYHALLNANGPNYVSTRNTAVGDSAMAINSGQSNTAVGVNALTLGFNSSYNVVLGDSAMGAAAGANNNVALGYKALKKLTASSNTAIGYQALENITTADGNTALGALAGNTNTGDHNTFIGYQADVSVAGVNNSMAIGNGAVVNASNKIRIGNAAITVVELTVLATLSDGRFKENVKEDVVGLDFINRLRPVTYNFNYNRFEDFLHPVKNNGARTASYLEPGYQQMLSKRSQQVETGFIAQEVEKAAIQTGYHFNGVIKPQNENDNYSLDYSKIVVPLVKAVQELSQENDSMKKQNESLEKKNKQLEAEILLIKAKLNMN